MPRKRNRKNKRRNFVRQENAPSKTTPINNDLCGIVSHKSDTISKINSPVCTPCLRKRSPRSVSTGKNNDVSFRTARSCSILCATPKHVSNASLNPTNLTLLFEERTNVTLRENKKRSISSIPKLHSPGVEKIPITVDVATQTVYYNNSLAWKTLDFNDAPDETLTSKVNGSVFLDDLNTCTPNAAGENSNLNKTAKDTTKFRVQRLFSDNFSPVIHNDLRNVPVDNDDTVRQFEKNVTSTPIEKLRNDKLFENRARNTMAAKLSSTLTPKTSNVAAFEKVWSQRINKRDSSINKSRNYCSVSPRKKFPFKFHDKYNMSARRNLDSKTKTFTPSRKSHWEKPDNVFNVSNSTVYRRFFRRIRHFHTQYLAKWVSRIIEICGWLGVTVIRSLTTIWKKRMDVHRSVLENSESTSPKRNCNCDSYRQQIAVLTTKVDVLNKDLMRIDDEHRKKAEILSLEMVELRRELMDDVRKKFDDFEKQLKSKCAAPAPPPLPPPPPPPPPPPLPTLMLSLGHVDTPTGNTLRRKQFKSDNDYSRPVISLDDILKVKLKKSDKPPVIRRSTQPIISKEMLDQIKLRPTSRSGTPSSLKDVPSSSSMMTSPGASLMKILSNVETNVHRVKRLRRVSGYSVDDSRKHTPKRERCFEY